MTERIPREGTQLPPYYSAGHVAICLILKSTFKCTLQRSLAVTAASSVSVLMCIDWFAELISRQAYFQLILWVSNFWYSDRPGAVLSPKCISRKMGWPCVMNSGPVMGDRTVFLFCCCNWFISLYHCWGNPISSIFRVVVLCCHGCMCGSLKRFIIWG